MYNRPLLLLPLLFLLSLPCFSFTFRQLLVSAVSLTTNTSTTYTILYQRYRTNTFATTSWNTIAINSNDSLTVTFPNQYAGLTGVTCTYSVNSTGVYNNNNCTVSGNVITLNGIFSNNSFVNTVTLRVANVVNPYPAGTTSHFYGTIGSDVSNATGTNSLVTITTAQASACSFTFNPNYVYTNPTNLVLTLTTKNQIPADGYIAVQFPASRKWSQDLSSTRFMPITTGAMACSSQSANVNTGIQCTGSATSALVTLTNVVSTATSSSTLSFSINNFNSPPTNQPVDGIIITTYTSSNSPIDACTAYVTGLQPKVIDSVAFTIQQANGLPIVVNKQYVITFQVTTTDLFSSTDYVTIDFPTGTSISNFPSANIAATLGVNTATSTYSAQKLTVYFLGTSTIPANSLIFITITKFIAPPSTLPTDNFIFTFLNSAGYPKMVSYQTLTAVAGSLSGTTTPTIATVNTVTSYAFSITTNDAMTSSGSMKLTFPSTLAIANSSSCAVISGTNMNPNPICAYNNIDNSITFTNINASSSNIQAQTFTLTVNGITNPPSTQPTSTFPLTTYYSSLGGQAGNGTLSFFTPTPATIDYTQASISSSSRINSATSVTYSLSFKITNTIPAGGSVIIYMPTALNIDTSAASGTCSVMLNSTASVSTSCTVSLNGSYYVVSYINPFTATVGSGSNITVSVGAVTNPATTQPFSPFSIYTYHSNTYLISSMINALSYSTNTPSNLAQNTLSRTSNKNAELTTYSLTLSQISDLEVNAKIVVTFPLRTAPQTNSTCSITYSNTTTTVGCSLVGNTFTVTSINSVIPKNSLFTLIFTNIRNPYSFTPLTTHTVTTLTSNNLYNYSSSTQTSSLQNTIPTSFNNMTYTYSPRQLNSSIDLQLNFGFSQYIVTPSYLLLSIDTYFEEGSMNCGSFVNFVGNCSQVSNNTIRVEGGFNNSVMGITVTGFKSTTSPPTGTTYTTLASFDSNNGKIDQSLTDIKFQLLCTMPCQTCNTNSTQCLSCYSTTTITTSIYYHSPTLKCYSSCPDTTYNNATTLTCQPCASICLNCQTTPMYCTKCVANSTFPYLNITNVTQTCVTSCVAGMYPRTSADPVQCVLCVSPCRTCTNQTTCLSCASSFYMFNGTCSSTCPNGTTIANGATNNCDPCDPICLTCSLTTANCTSCTSPNVYYNGSCQSSCPAGGTLAPSNGICTPCISTCLYCLNTITNCTACNLTSSNPFLFQNSCLTQCPQTYYNITLTGKCILCVTAGINCVNCSSASSCLSCDSGFVLYNGECLAYTPSGFVNVSGVAVACQGQCKTCAVTTTNCTSCKTLNLQGNACLSTCQIGYIPVSQICTICQSPCSTCSQTTSNCTSCLTILTPTLYLTGNSCQQTCPNYTYPNMTTLTCASCISPCSICTSYTSCSSCISNYSILTTICYNICPTGYTGVNGVCRLCSDNCKICSGATNYCLTCNNGTYFLNSSNSCLNDCGTGLYAQYTNQTCIGCTAPCKTCVNTSTTCTSCTTGNLHNLNCVANCPSAMYSSGNVCYSCSTNCSACTSGTTCTQCSGASLLYNGGCVQSCPNTAPVVLNNQCMACSTQQCYACTPGDVCITCRSGYLFLNAQCLGNCPNQYSSNGTHCISLKEKVIEAASTPNTFPIPFTIAAIVLIIACLMSRLQFAQTYLSGAVFALLSLLQFLALIYFLYLYFKDYYLVQSVPFWIAVAALIYLYIINIVACIAQCIFLCYQKQFQDWQHSSRFHGCFYGFVNVLSLCCSHKIRNILFCKLFTFRLFSAKLDSVNHFKIFNIFSLLSLASSAAAIFAAAAALKYVSHQEQIYYQCIDVIVLSSILALLAFLNTHKQKDFFEEVTPDGFSLHKKNKLDQDYFPDKIKMQGLDGELQQGFLGDNNYALASKAALRFDDGSSNDVYSDSLENVDEKYPQDEESQRKQYEEISVQAYDLLDEKDSVNNVTGKTVKAMPKAQRQSISIQANSMLEGQHIDRGLNLSELPPQGFPNDSSNFTRNNFFQKSDASMQYTYVRGAVDRSQQMTLNQNDMSIQKFQDGIAVDCSIQKYANSANDVSIQPSIRQHNRRQQSNQFSIVEHQDQYVQYDIQKIDQAVQPTIDYNDIAIQPSLDPSRHEMAIQYHNQEEYNQFQEDLEDQLEATPSNIFYNEDIEDEPQRNLEEEKEEHFDIEGDNIKSYQNELEDRIRQREKELAEVKRKLMVKERNNEQRQAQLNRANHQDERLELGGMRQNQFKPKNSIEKTMGQVSNRGRQETGQSYNLQLQSKQLRKGSQVVAPAHKGREKTLQEVNISRQRTSGPDHTLQQFELNQGEGEATRPPNPINYEQVNRSLQSQQQPNIANNSNSFVRTNPPLIPAQSQQTRRANNSPPLSDYEMKSIETKRNFNTTPNAKLKYEVNVQQVDKRLSDGEDEEELEDASQGDLEPTGIVNYHTRPKFRQASPDRDSELSGTIQEIPRHYNKVDNDKTISNSSIKVPQSKANKQDLRNYYNEHISNTVQGNEKPRGKQIPKDNDNQRMHINKLYPRQMEKEEQKNQRGPGQRGSTFAMAGRAQLSQDVAKKKSKQTKKPLDTHKNWQTKNQERMISDQSFRNGPTTNQNNRTNLVKNKQLQNFASHLVLPQQSDKQETSFQKNLLRREKEEKAVSEKKGINSRVNNQTEEIEVHFDAEPFSPGITGRNDLPEVPRTGMSRKLPSQASNSFYNQDSEEMTNYKGQMILDQMQQRPNNDDLQEYYRKKNSKEKRRRSNSRVDKSTEKIYLQKMDKKR